MLHYQWQGVIRDYSVLIFRLTNFSHMMNWNVVQVRMMYTFIQLQLYIMFIIGEKENNLLGDPLYEEVKQIASIDPETLVCR